MRSIALPAALSVLALIVTPDAQTSVGIITEVVTATTSAPSDSFQAERGKSATIARWTARAIVSGGIVSQSRQVSIDANGHVEVTNTRGNMRCSADVDAAAAQKLEAVIARANPEKWKESYALETNPNGCCDQAATEVTVERTDSGGRRTIARTRWFMDSKHRVPADVTTLFDAVWGMRRACEL